MNKLSVVTITYNHEKFIGQALESIVNQKTNFDFEVLVGDDCSTDKTREIVTEYAKKFPKIIKPYFNKKNVGSLNNYLETLSKVESEYVAFCDGDDYWCDDNKLQEQVDFLDSHKDYTVCFHQTRVFFENSEVPDDVFPRSHFAKTTLFEDLIKENYIPANTVMYRWKFDKRNSIKKVFPEGIYPGDYYTHLLHAKDGKIYFINKVMSCYRRHSGGVWWLSSQKNSRDAFTEKYGIPYLNFFKAIEKNFDLDESTFRFQKEYLINDLIKCYFDKRMFDELVALKNDNKDIFDKYISNYQYQNSIVGDLTKFRKIIYMLLVDPELFKSKIKNRIKNNHITDTVFGVVYRKAKYIKNYVHNIRKRGGES